ncbi:Bud site selection protein [Actinidia chinensis var. chinensis]|uniref:Bud site selection protein n=1 Tax=Actinidia chinensis var. chinensis TaxID=1590841 RepID=A0A2R6PGE2_ACTCC|nr:Bud site selection protein [Actinidia chinensis var. chinensis]
MDNGGGIEDGGGANNLAHKFAALAVSSSNNAPPISNNNNDGLFQVMKAVEAAEATIKQQAEENTRLRTELQKKLQELEKHKSDNSTGRRPSLVYHWDDHAEGPHSLHELDSSVVSQGDGVTSTSGTFLSQPSSTVIQQIRNNEDRAMQTRAESHSESIKIDGSLKVLSGGQRTVDSAGFSQFSSPSTSFSPRRHQMEVESDPQFNLSGHGLMPMAEVNNSSVWKQDVFVKIREHEEEILQLRKLLADYSIKETQIRSEKYVLEKRIAYMRMAFDQQQQDLVDAASKALSYRQDIIEENIRLTYALQAAQEERSTFVSSLLPLLAEYSLQPPVPDAKSIIGNLKVLFRLLQEKLIFTEAKLKESRYQLAPWRSDVNASNFPLQSPSHPMGVALTSNKNGLELVPQPAYSHENIPISSSNLHTTADWDILGSQRGGLGDGLSKSLEPDNMVRYSTLASRNMASQDVPGKLSVSQDDFHHMRYSQETTNKQVTFSDPVSSTEMDDLEVEAQQNERDHSTNWGSKNSPYSTTIDDPTSSYSPYLPPVLEEPSSSFSEAGDDDPLPAIEGLQISGDAIPGQELQACGYSINGTTSCNFEWVRHLEDGSVNYIEGAKQPKYLVTADDIDTYLAIEVQPLDDRKRKGELVKVFANEHGKITCDPDMQNCIEKTLLNGHTSYRVSVSIGYLDIWEPVTLAIKREGYSIKGSGPSGILVTEKFSPSMNVTIPFGHPTEFSIVGSGGERILRAEASSTDISCSRDTIVLTLRLFILRAGEKRKGKKRNLNLFFKH